MANHRIPITIPVISESYEDLIVPGVIVEVDAASADELGAFEENALTEAEAWESNLAGDLPEAPHG